MNLDQLLQDKRYLFWALQFAGWSSWAITFYLGMLVWGKAPATYAIYLPIVSSIGLLITLLLRALYRRVWDSPVVLRAVTVLVASYLAGAAWMAARVLIFSRLFGDTFAKETKPDMGFWGHFEGTTSAFMVMVVWSALYFGIKFYLVAQEEQRRRLNATAMAHEAQLKMLHYQLNPHFLFNTLNAISTLILDKDTELANTMVSRLSRFLRYSLDNDPMQTVTVAEEVKALKLYLDIEKVRFGNRLQLSFAVEDGAQSALMPSLLLQPLVENSIKYAIAQAVDGGSIAVRAWLADGELHLSVADDGPGLDLKEGGLPEGHGVGLANCRERLKELYGGAAGFSLDTTDPHGLTVNIRMPLERAAPAT